MRILPHIAALLAVALIAAADPVIDLRGSAPTVDDRNARIRLVLEGEPSRSMRLERCEGAWTAAEGEGVAVAITDLVLADGALRGRIQVGGAEVEILGRVEALPEGEVLDPATEDPELRFWRNLAESQSVTAKLSGTWRSAAGDGAISGHLAPPERPGHWSMGTADADGLRLRFDLGHQRRNWNTSRVAVLALPQPLDLTACRALRLALRTARVRDDAEVSLWLREADGSWWYWRSAATLASSSTASELPFSALQEAEWVAPGSHVDEDYVFDRATVTHIGIGIIDPFGVGPVDFTVTALAGVSGSEPVADGQAAVTAAWLDVNGFTTIPVGIFGGYAPDLPHQLRPGSQRYLYANGFPRIPRLTWARIGAEDITDGPGLLARLAGAEPLAAYLRDRYDALLPRSGVRRGPRTAAELFAALPAEAATEGARRLREFEKRTAITDPVERERRRATAEAESMRRKLAEFFAPLLGDLELTGDALPPAPDPIAGVPEGSRTWVAIRNRRALAAALPGLVAALPGDGPSEAFYVDCFGERKEVAVMLQRSDWAASLAALGRAHAAASRAEGYAGVLEFWNEPYLNWAERSRVNYQSRYFRTDLAAIGAPVRILRADGSLRDEDIVPHLAWRRDNSGAWQVHDPTAFSYWSGRGNGWIYDRMFAALGAAAKTENPAVQLAAGWGFRWHEDHWAAWELLYKPTIDRGIAWIDLVTEHHYQGDTRAMAGSYEVLTAYGMTAHGKWLRAINTECNDLVDAPSRGAVDTPEKAKAATGYRRLCYNLRDLIYAVQESPDKLAARAMIHGGDEPYSRAIFSLLAPLRGRMLATSTGDRDLWCVASVDGTDPLALRPGGGYALTCALWNDLRVPRPVDLAINAPPGFVFAGPATIRTSRLDRETFDFGIDERSAPADGTTVTLRQQLAERTAVVVSIPLNGTPAPGPLLRRRQAFAPHLLAMVRPDAPWRSTIAIDPSWVHGARAASLRLVVESLADGEGSITIGSRRIDLPATRDADNGNTILKLPLALSDLAPRIDLSASCVPGQAGWRLCLASIVVDDDGE